MGRHVKASVSSQSLSVSHSSPYVLYSDFRCVIVDASLKKNFLITDGYRNFLSTDIQNLFQKENYPRFLLDLIKIRVLDK